MKEMSVHVDSDSDFPIAWLTGESSPVLPATPQQVPLRASFAARHSVTALATRVDVTNDSAAVANVRITRGAATLHRMAVPACAGFTCGYTLPPSEDPLAINISCDGTMLDVRERTLGEQAENERTDARVLFVATAAGASFAAMFVAAIASALWFGWLRRRPKPAPRRPAGIEEAVDVAPPIAPFPDTELVVDRPEEMPPHEEMLLGDHAHEAQDPAPIVADTGEMNVVEVLDREPIRVTPIRLTPKSREVRPRRRDSSLFPLLVGFVLAGALVAGFILAHPHVGDLGAPNTVLEGSAIDVPYTSSGIGSLRYSIIASNGTTIVAGLLAQRSGLLHIAIPAVGHNEAYRVRLVMAGPLGDASNEATVGANALPVTRVVTRTTAGPLIRSFAISRSMVNHVPTLVAFYDAIADSGMLRLMDARGIQYQAASLSPTGQTTLTLPAGIDPGTLVLELHAFRNGSTVDSRIALPAGGTDVAVASPPPDPGASPSDAPPIVVPDRAVGAAPVRVQIMHHYPNLHVALLDENARKIVGIDVPHNASMVALHHPPVSTTTRMTVEATYRVNDEADTIVRPVLLLPGG